MKVVLQIILSLSFLTSVSAYAKGVVEKTKDTTSEAYQDTKKVVKKSARKVGDKTCEMVNGKLECAAKKVKHSAENAADEVKDKANDLKKE